MKKIHLILLVVAAVTALTSIYSLAAINQTYKISYEWYSEYKNNYTFEKRDTSRDKWILDELKPEPLLKVITDEYAYKDIQIEENLSEEPAFTVDFNQYLMIYCSFGKVSSLEYRIKIMDIAQRGDVVEIVVSTNSPAKVTDSNVEQTEVYYPRDIVRIDKGAFPVKGKLLMVFKDQSGSSLGEQYCFIK